MTLYELYKDVEETQKRLEKQIDMVLLYESEVNPDEEGLREWKESSDR